MAKGKDNAPAAKTTKNPAPTGNNKTTKGANVKQATTTKNTASTKEEKPYYGLNVYSVVAKKRVDLDPKTATLTKNSRGGFLLQGTSISEGSEGTKAAGAVSKEAAHRLVEDGYFDESVL